MGKLFCWQLLIVGNFTFAIYVVVLIVGNFNFPICVVLMIEGNLFVSYHFDHEIISCLMLFNVNACYQKCMFHECKIPKVCYFSL